MYLTTNMSDPLSGLIGFAITIYIYVVIARAIVSWIDVDPDNAFVRFLHDATEPPLRWLRQFVPDLGGLDISPFLLIVILMIIRNLVV